MFGRIGIEGFTCYVEQVRLKDLQFLANLVALHSKYIGIEGDAIGFTDQELVEAFNTEHSGIGLVTTTRQKNILKFMNKNPAYTPTPADALSSSAQSKLEQGGGNA